MLFYPKKLLLATLIVLLGYTLNLSYADTLINAPYQVCFKPSSKCNQLVTNSVDQAQNSIDIQAYRITDASLLLALEKAKTRGVKVRIILDKSNLNQQFYLVNILIKYHIPIKINSKVDTANNNIIVIDGQKTIIDSASFGGLSQRNHAQNILLVTSQSLATAYLDNFRKYWRASETPIQYCMSSASCNPKRLSLQN